jgi:outer membrane protein OmpA-like peptidoglycan-associated protein
MNASRLRNAVALLALLVLCAACGKPRSAVLLLPDADGHVGSVEVKADQGSQTLTQAGTITRLAPGAAPMPPEAIAEQERELVFGQVVRALPQKPARFILYFLSDGVQLTPESQAQLPKVLETARERNSLDIAVVGHSSRSGDAAYNMALSRRRAEAVRQLLVKSGMSDAVFEVTSHGSNNPLVVSKDPNEPKNRRVELTIR